MKLTEIQELIKFVARSGVTEVELEQKDFKILIKANPTPKKRGAAAQQAEQAVIQAQVPMVPQVQAVVPPVAQAVPAAPVAPAPAPAAEAAPPAADAGADDSKYITIKAPMIGTFYRSSSPDTPAFINVGDEIKPGKVICIVEAMKLFNEIEAEISGKIVKVLADDASPVEYDQPLFLVDPS